MDFFIPVHNSVDSSGLWFRVVSENVVSVQMPRHVAKGTGGLRRPSLHACHFHGTRDGRPRGPSSARSRALHRSEPRGQARGHLTITPGRNFWGCLASPRPLLRVYIRKGARRGGN